MLLHAISPIYIILGILFFLLILLLCISTFKPYYDKKKLKRKLETYLLHHSISFSIGTASVDYVLHTHEKNYSLKIVDIPDSCDLQINSKDTWQIFFNASMHSGVYKTQFVNGIEDFMKNEDENRIILLTREPKHRKLVLNESDMRVVTCEDEIYKSHFITEKELDYLLKL